ncbi:ATP-binding protein [Thermodesulfobacteriota bacterium]
MWEDTAPIKSIKPGLVLRTLERIENLIPDRLKPRRGFLLSFKNQILISTLFFLIGGIILVAGSLQVAVFPQLEGDPKVIVDLKLIHLLVGLVCVPAVWLFVVILSRRITLPLQDLTKKAEEISLEAGIGFSEDCYSGSEAAKKLLTEAQNNSARHGDEILQLAISFNRMLAHLRASELCLRESEAKYRFLFHQAPSPIFVLDTDDLKILDVNARAEQEYQYSKQELLGKDFSDLSPSQEVHEIRQLLVDLVDGVVGRQPVLRHSRRDGSSFLVNLRGRLSGFKDRPTFIVAAWDVTEKLEYEATLVQTSKMATLGEMATGIAHELNQPLNVIKIGSEFFLKSLKLDKPLTGKQMAKTAEEMSSNVDRAARIITHLRTFGRKAEETMSPISVNGSIQGVFTLMGTQLAKLGIRCEVSLDEKLPLILGDENRLEQVFINLVVNARDAIRQQENDSEAADGDSDKLLTVRSFLEDDRVVVTVSDTGSGVPDALREKIFEPFFTTKRVGEGTGIGLSISYGIVKEHRGTIKVDETYEHGARFRLTFPVVDSHREREYDQDSGN